MNCADVDSLICDYVDGTLDAAGRRVVEAHIAGCEDCAALVADSTEAVAFMERAAEVEPPPQLITRILFDAPWRKAERGKGLRGWLDRIFSPLLQPRLVMGMAMSVLSLSLMFHNVGQVRVADLAPSKVIAGIEDRATRAWARTVKFYDNLKVVYQVESLLHEWQQQDEEQAKPPARPPAQPANSSQPGASSPGDDPHRLPVRSVPNQ